MNTLALSSSQASAAREISRSLARDKEQMMESLIVAEIALIDSKSPGELPQNRPQ
jgi:hypothetical protein